MRWTVHGCNGTVITQDSEGSRRIRTAVAGKIADSGDVHQKARRVQSDPSAVGGFQGDETAVEDGIVRTGAERAVGYRIIGRGRIPDQSGTITRVGPEIKMRIAVT